MGRCSDMVGPHMAALKPGFFSIPMSPPPHLTLSFSLPPLTGLVTHTLAFCESNVCNHLHSNAVWDAYGKPKQTDALLRKSLGAWEKTWQWPPYYVSLTSRSSSDLPHYCRQLAVLRCIMAMDDTLRHNRSRRRPSWCHRPCRYGLHHPE
jgi:hypothetical protein